MVAAEVADMSPGVVDVDVDVVVETSAGATPSPPEDNPSTEFVRALTKKPSNNEAAVTAVLDGQCSEDGD